MDYSTRYKTLHKGLKDIRKELLALRNSLLSEEERAVIETDGVDEVTEPDDVEEVNEAEDFFAHLTRDSQAQEGDGLYLAAVKVITELGYASTLVLQQRLGITYRQAMNVIDQLEEDGLVGPAHGFRPHKVLNAAYTFQERTN